MNKSSNADIIKVIESPLKIDKTKSADKVNIVDEPKIITQETCVEEIKLNLFSPIKS